MFDGTLEGRVLAPASAVEVFHPLKHVPPIDEVGQLDPRDAMLHPFHAQQLGHLYDVVELSRR